MEQYGALAKLFGAVTVVIGTVTSSFFEYLQGDPVPTGSEFWELILRGGIIGIVGLFVVYVGLRMTKMFLKGQEGINQHQNYLISELMEERAKLVEENAELRNQLEEERADDQSTT